MKCSGNWQLLLFSLVFYFPDLYFVHWGALNLAEIVVFPFSFFLFLTGKEKVRRWDKYVKTFSSDKLFKIEDGRELENWRLRYSEN